MKGMVREIGLQGRLEGDLEGGPGSVSKKSGEGTDEEFGVLK